MAYHQACQVICVSAVVANEVMRGAKSARATVVYNGVDPELFKPAETGPAPPTVLCVGNLIPSKGHDTLLRALAVVKKHHPEVVCEIIGDGPERRRLIGLAEQLGIGSHVRFRGRQSRRQVAEAMGRCTVFALPSRYEGLGCVYLEAMATGKVAIGSRGQGIEEIIQPETNGFLVTAGDPQELAATLARVLADGALRSYIGHRARGTVLAGLTLQHQATHLSQIYEECAR
jgi:glycosyltransferase involved in cell wall biosynthesis